MSDLIDNDIVIYPTRYSVSFEMSGDASSAMSKAAEEIARRFDPHIWTYDLKAMVGLLTRSDFRLPHSYFGPYACAECRKAFHLRIKAREEHVRKSLACERLIGTDREKT